jgi:hypothetical protein
MPSKLQKEVKDLYEQNNWDTDPTLLLVAMQEELGELCARWLYELPVTKKPRTTPILLTWKLVTWSI